jgi:hypothetical protein
MLRMSMRRPIATLASAVLLLVSPLAVACAASAATTPLRAARLCATGHCHTIVESPDARIFRVTRMPRGYVSYKVIYGEDRHTGKVTTFLGGLVEAQPSFELPVLDGAYAAFELVRPGKYNEEGALVSVERVDLRTGRRETAGGLLEEPPERSCGGGLAYKAPGITDLLVTARGAVAWIIGGTYEPVPGGPHLHGNRICLLSGTVRTPTVLAAGDTIEPRSLAATRGRVYWSEGGKPESAPLQG